MTETATPLPTAPVIKRLAAMIYDSLLVFGVLFAATLPLLILSAGNTPSIDTGEVIHELDPAAEGHLFQLYLLAVFIGFYCWFWLRKGQTLGMRAWRLQVENMQGERINIKQCLLRLGGAALSLACLGAGYWWAWIDKDKLSWHDRLSNSSIVLLPKQ